MVIPDDVRDWVRSVFRACVLRHRSFLPGKRERWDRDRARNTMAGRRSRGLDHVRAARVAGSGRAWVEMAPGEWSLASARTIGARSGLPWPGSSGGLSELEDRQLGSAEPAHDAELEGPFDATGLRSIRARVDWHLRPRLEPALIASGSLLGHALGGRQPAECLMRPLHAIPVEVAGELAAHLRRGPAELGFGGSIRLSWSARIAR